jgi:hypothetical protein
MMGRGGAAIGADDNTGREDTRTGASSLSDRPPPNFTQYPPVFTNILRTPDIGP